MHKRIIILLFAILLSACSSSIEDKVKEASLSGKALSLGETLKKYSHAQKIEWDSAKEPGLGESAIVAIYFKEGHKFGIRFFQFEGAGIRMDGAFFQYKTGAIIPVAANRLLMNSLFYRLEKNMPILEELEDNYVDPNTLKTYFK